MILRYIRIKYVYFTYTSNLFINIISLLTSMLRGANCMSEKKYYKHHIMLVVAKRTKIIYNLMCSLKRININVIVRVIPIARKISLIIAVITAKARRTNNDNLYVYFNVHSLDSTKIEYLNKYIIIIIIIIIILCVNTILKLY